MSIDKTYFPDSEMYERAMGRWSRLLGEKFLDWLNLSAGLRWIDVGCGTGAFTELVIDRNAPRAISAVDPSEGQVAYARARPKAGRVDYRQGDAISLSYGDDEFDVAVMALVVQFLPDPQKAMSEINRVVKRGGIVAAYIWDEAAGGSPARPINQTLKMMALPVMRSAPNDRFRAAHTLSDLFSQSGLKQIETCTIQIQLEFRTFDEFWAYQMPQVLARCEPPLTDADIVRLKPILKERLAPDRQGQITYMAGANAIKGVVPN